MQVEMNGKCSSGAAGLPEIGGTRCTTGAFRIADCDSQCNADITRPPTSKTRKERLNKDLIICKLPYLDKETLELAWKAYQTRAALPAPGADMVFDACIVRSRFLQNLTVTKPSTRAYQQLFVVGLGWALVLSHDNLVGSRVQAQDSLQSLC